VSRDGERLIELINELGSRVSQVLTDMVPPKAQVHLLNAQRELITALMLIYEHRVTDGASGRPRRRAAAPHKASPRRRPSPRAGKIPIE
jgi:hypothetical protein